MPKNEKQRIIDSKQKNNGYVFVSGSSGGGGVTDHGLLTGLADDDHTQYLNNTRGDVRYVPLTRSVTGSGGLTGGGALSADAVLSLAAGVAGDGLALAAGVLSVNTSGGLTTSGDNVVIAAGVAGDGLTLTSGVLSVNTTGAIGTSGDNLILQTPGTLTVATTNATATNHTHAVTSSAAPGAAASLLASTSSGGLTLVTLTTTTKVRTPLLDTASGALTLTPATTVTLTDGKAFTGTTGFASGFTGSGWQLDYGNTYASQATLEVDNLIVRGLLRVYELVIHKIRTGNGSYLFAPGGKVNTVSGSGPYVLTFDEDHGLAEDDLLRAQKFTGSGTYQSNCTVTAISLTDTKVATVTLVSGTAPAVGFEYVRIGNSSDTSRQGSVYITSDDTNAPYIDIVDGVTNHSGFGATRTRMRAGNLNGSYGYSSRTFGVAMGPYVSGFPNVTVDATNGIRIRQYTTDVITLDTSGDSYFAGVMTIGASGEIRQGTGTLGSNYTGLRIWRDGDIGRIGGYNANVLQWSASTDGVLYAGAGNVGLSYNGVMLKTGAHGPTYSWPFTHGGLHVVDTLPATTWRASWLFGEPNKVYTGAQPRGWIARFDGDLTAADPGSGTWSTADRALQIEDASHSWAVYHEGYTTGLAVLDTANTFTATQFFQGSISYLKSDPTLYITNTDAYSTTNTQRVDFQANTSTTNATLCARMETSFTDVTHATRTGRYTFGTYDSGVFQNTMSIVGGKVGMGGNTSPAVALDVTGDITASGFVKGTDFRIPSGTGYLKVNTTAAVTWSTTAVDMTGTLTVGNFGSAWTQLNASYAVYYKKFGDMVFLKGTCTAAGTGAFTVGTLPSSPDCRPPAKIFLNVRNANGTATAATIDTDGTVACGTHEAGVAITFDNITFCNS